MNIAQTLAPLTRLVARRPLKDGARKTATTSGFAIACSKGAPRTRVAARAKAIVIPARRIADTTLAAAGRAASRHLGPHRQGAAARGGASPRARSCSPRPLDAEVRTLDCRSTAWGTRATACAPRASLGRKVTLIAANTDVGVLYGAFAWLRAVQMRRRARDARRVVGAEGAAAHAEPLGQPRPHDRARLRRRVDLGLVEAAGTSRTRATSTTRAPTPRSASTASRSTT